MKRIVRMPGTSASTDVQREIDHHIELRAKELEATGMSPEAARRAALEAFGDRDAITREVAGIRQSTVRARGRRDWLDEIKQDLVVGCRILRRAPSFTIVALLTLAVGIGANTAIFGVLRSVLLRPLPYPESNQLVQLWTDYRANGRKTPEWLSPAEFIEWRKDNTTFSAMAAYGGWGPVLTSDGEPEALSGAVVTGDFFGLLRANPAIGRLITPADDDANAERVVVLGNAFWRRRFGSNPTIIGHNVTLNGVDWRVVGVLPENFHAPMPGATDIFGAMRRPADSRCGLGCIVWHGIGRLKPNVSLAAAQADIGRIAAQIARESPQTNAKVGAWLIPLHEQITGPTKPALVTLSIAVAFVLLIGCVNLANLLLVRGASRGREIGVRAALGAGRSRVIRQLLTENVLLALGGGALGIALGVAGTRAFSVLVPKDVLQVQDIRVDGAVLAFAVCVTLLAATVFGLVPAIHAVRAGLMNALRTNTGQSSRQTNRLRSSLVVTQLAFAVVLLVGAGLLLRSFLLMQRVDLGYRGDGIYLAGVSFPRARYADGNRVNAALSDLLTRLRPNPAVSSAEVSDLPPLSGGGDQDMGVNPIGVPAAPGRPKSVWYRSVTPGYFAAMHMKLVAGRGFTADDRDGAAPVGIINEEAARRFWPGENPVGRLLQSGDTQNSQPLTIVGVVASVRHDGPNQPYKNELFLPIGQLPSRGITLVLEPARDVASLGAAVRQALHDVDPLIPVGTLDPMAQVVGETTALPRLYATLVGLFAGAALLLAALGVYGVMAYAVAQRQREIGVRLALGAEPSGIRRMVLGEGGRLALVGLVLGLAAAAITGQLIGKLLFGVSAHDAQTFIIVPLVLGAVTIMAAWIPARRAMHLDPLVAIREE